MGRDGIMYDTIPNRTIRAITHYVEEGLEPGSFVRAVLSNDLKEACGRADDHNRQALFEIVCYCYNEIPSNCWGSEEIVTTWLERHQPRDG